MNFGLSTYFGYGGEESLQKQLSVFGENGIKFVEICAFFAEEPGWNPRQETITILNRSMEEYGVKACSVHAPRWDISALDEERRRSSVDETKKAIGFLGRLNGVRTVVIHPEGAGSWGSVFPRERRRKKSRESLTEISQFCKEMNLQLAVENTWPGELGDTVKDLINLSDSISSGEVGICLDTGHFHMQGENPAMALKKIGSRLLNLHISDNRGDNDSHLLPFEGIINWSQFMEELNGSKFEGIFMFEIEGKKDWVEKAKEVKKVFNLLMKS